MINEPLELTESPAAHMDDDSSIIIKKVASQDSANIVVPPSALNKKSINSYSDLHHNLLASGRANSVASNSEVVSSNHNSAPENVNERSIQPTHRMKTSEMETVKLGASGMQTRQQA